MSAGPVTISNSSSGTVTVFDLGALLAGDTVRAGLGGAALTVSSINTSTRQVTLANASGASVILEAGTRLIDYTSPPTAYADPLGVNSMGSFVFADSGGRATAYLTEGAYDYIVYGDQTTIDATSTATLTASASTLSWNHTASGESRAVLVAISWQEGTSTETLTGVTYDDIEMTRVAHASLVDLFYLVNPPTGSKTIVVTWSGSGAKGAIAAAVSMTSAAQAGGIGVSRTGSGTGTSATIKVKNTNARGLALAMLGVNTISAVATATASAGTALWNTSAGTGPASTRTVGAGVWAPSTGGDVDLTWTLSASRTWATAGIEVLPAGIRLYSDQTGTACQTVPYGLNATNFASLQEAIDALPVKGGVLLIPAGTYRLRTGLVIDKPNVTILGEGDTTVIMTDDPVNLPIDLLTINAGGTRLSRLKFDCAADEQDLENGTCCIVMNGPGVSSRIIPLCIMENVNLTRASKYGLWARDVILFTAISCNVLENYGTGLRIQGTQTAVGSSVALRFYSSNFSYNGCIGADVGDGLDNTGVVGVTFFGCAFEGNLAGGVEDLAEVGTGLNASRSAKIEILSCYFEVAPAGAAQFVRLVSCLAATVENCWIQGGTIEANQPDRGAGFYNCAFTRFANNAVEHVTSEIVLFDATCTDSVEFCNRDMDVEDDPARINIVGYRVIGMSRKALGVTRHHVPGTRPDAGTNPQPGSLLWVDEPDFGDKNLQVWDGSNWRGIDLV